MSLHQLRPAIPEQMPLHLDALPPRIAAMVQLLVQHQEIICAYDSGALVLNYRGQDIRPQLDKVGLHGLIKPIERT
jgi:hypothetical protein